MRPDGAPSGESPDGLADERHRRLLSVLVTEIGHPSRRVVADPLRSPLFNILMIDLTLAGDNAIVVGMAASRVRKDMRAKVIFWGIAGAVVLRILFSGVASSSCR